MIAVSDLFIFGFGSAVCLCVGSALATLIVVKNRINEQGDHGQPLDSDGELHAQGLDRSRL